MYASGLLNSSSVGWYVFVSGMSAYVYSPEGPLPSRGLPVTPVMGGCFESVSTFMADMYRS